MRYAVIIFLILAGCESLAVPEPETQREELVVLESLYQAALKSVESLVDQGLLVGDDAEKAADMIERAGASVRTARSFVDDNNSSTFIRRAEFLVSQLITFLDEQPQ